MCEINVHSEIMLAQRSRIVKELGGVVVKNRGDVAHAFTAGSSGDTEAAHRASDRADGNFGSRQAVSKLLDRFRYDIG
jgi:hypothetical protein